MFTKKNDLLILSGALVFALFIMGLVIYGRNQKDNKTNTYVNITAQSQSTDIDDIEKDLKNTELQNIGKELEQIEKELEQAY